MSHAENMVYLFGGSQDDELLNDALKYDIAAQTFYRVKIEDKESLPLAREFHQAAIVNEENNGAAMFVIGGGETNGKLNDIQRLPLPDGFHAEAHSIRTDFKQLM